ncbi:MAG: pentapeptide repeat-containing protein [Cyanobacteria bacterium J06649_4]
MKANFKDLFKALGKGVADGVTGQWGGVAKDLVDASVAVGLANEPSQLAWLLIYRSLTQAIVSLVKDSQELLIDQPDDLESFSDRLSLSLEEHELTIRPDFFDQPQTLSIIKAIQIPLKQWLEGFIPEQAQAQAISNRLPTYFIFALNREWAARPQDYVPIKEQFQTPFTSASERRQGWLLYSAWLQKQVEEPMFSEAFGLKQVYVPLRAYYRRKKVSRNSPQDIDNYFKGNHNETFERMVVELEEELDAWVQTADPGDAIRVISGGPGSGKSSFAKMFAAHHVQKSWIPLLFIPLHQFDPKEDLVEAVGAFVEDDCLLKANPLYALSRELRLLIIFDGLDELAMQGKIAKEISQNFVREVQRKLERFNQREIRLQVLISGRELAVQDNSSEFRNPRQILHLLPHFVHENKRKKEGNEAYIHGECLQDDRRQTWWQCYGAATGKSYDIMPDELNQGNLVDITAQPLLNYLVALSYDRGGLTFTEDTNLNQIYQNLLDAVYERGYERRTHVAIRGMKQRDFVRILEEIALAAWHGDGRTTTVGEIERHCDNSGLRRLLGAFEEGAEAGVTRLLTAFYFRQSGGLRDNERTFEFTHKSFGEYLAARRIVRAIGRIQAELDARDDDPDRGWDERDALKHWAEVCGASRMDTYLFNFVIDEVKLQAVEKVRSWQPTLAKLIGFMLRHDMPMERLQLKTFHQANEQARNAEEALLAALNACARVTEELSKIDWPTPKAFGTWFARLTGQREDGDDLVISNSLSLLNLETCTLISRDFSRAALYRANLYRANLYTATLFGAALYRANLLGANLYRANLDTATLCKANLEEANLEEANLEEANLEEANLFGANLGEATLEAAYLYSANLEEANLHKANLHKANLENASLENANLENANLLGANLLGANLLGANLLGIKWNVNTNWQDIKGIETAKNVPEVLKEQLGL